VAVAKYLAQLGLFATAEPDPIREKLAAIDLNAITPLQARTLLAELTKEARA
jgi:hypothetical protein